MNTHQIALNWRLEHFALSPPPFPWRRLPPISVGGLEAVGFSPDGRYLLSVTPSERGIISAVTGERLARDRDPSASWLDTSALTCKGIGPVEGLTLPVAGIFGGGLPLTTSEWHLELVSPSWPDSFVVLSAVPATVFLDQPGSFKVAPSGGDDRVVVYGFNRQSTSFVVATSHTIDLFTRENGAA